jgi:hypothetical protein
VAIRLVRLYNLRTTLCAKILFYFYMLEKSPSVLDADVFVTGIFQ